LQNPGDLIRIPRDATGAHYEGELMVVIRKRLRDASPEKACGDLRRERKYRRAAQPGGLSAPGIGGRSFSLPFSTGPVTGSFATGRACVVIETLRTL
jgi:hypothetical protein